MMKTISPTFSMPLKTNSNTGVTYLVFTTQGAGGAEKRLTGSWLQLKKNGLNLKLVCSTELLEALCKQSEFRNLSQYNNDIVLIPFTGSVIEDTKKLKYFIENTVLPGDKLHFVGSYPVLLKHKKDVIYLYSLTTCSLNNVNIKGKLYLLLSVAKSTRADILDPRLFNLAKKLFFYKRRAILQTSSSYVDTDKYHPVYPKKNWIVFLGRFLDGKQILRYVELLPAVHKAILEAGINDHHFHIIGYGPQEAEVGEILKRSGYSDIPFTLQRSHTPDEILRHSKIFLSLNAENNYPSKSLLEGLAAGNIPVVTDVGTTEMIAPRNFSHYIHKNFSSKELAAALISILKEDEDRFRELSEQARSFVMENYNLDKMADYYLNFYN